MTINQKHIGSNFDDFLEEEGILEECKAVATKRVEGCKKITKPKKIIRFFYNLITFNWIALH